MHSQPNNIIDHAEEESNVPPASYSITAYPTDFTLEVLCSKLEKNTIIFPKFQREYVWSIKQASRLIESFMVELPVPAIYLYVDSDGKHLVIDGRQRLQSIYYFFKGEFKKSNSPKKPFRLVELNEKSRLYKKTFTDLDDIPTMKNSYQNFP